MVLLLLRAGVPLGPMVLLTVRGRTSGQPRTTPVDLFERDGRRWLVATHAAGAAQWVLNLRVAGNGIVTRGRRSEEVTVVELSPAAAALVFQTVVGPRMASPLRGLILRHTLDVGRRASVEEFTRMAERHPVFELDTPRG
jgi:deazaflavin-dependent oxidoreductase (nitroreductase family)